jgi:hypothetical protein
MNYVIDEYVERAGRLEQWIASAEAAVDETSGGALPSNITRRRIMNRLSISVIVHVLLFVSLTYIKLYHFLKTFEKTPIRNIH